MGMRIYSDVAVDDFSLSPECFGINIPPEHLNGYNYWNVRHTKSPTHKDFANHNCKYLRAKHSFLDRFKNLLFS